MRKKEIVNNFHKISTIVFFPLWVLSAVVGAVESVSYNGFFQKHFGINFFWLLILLVCIGIVHLILKIFSKQPTDSKLFKAQTLALTCLIGFYVLLKVANRFTHANFVFSKIHIQPDNLFSLVLVFLIPFLISGIHAVLRSGKNKIAVTLTSLCLLLIGFNFYKIYKTELWAIRFIVSNPLASYDDKMRRAVGPVFYNYTKFIVAHTPENASLLMPPQAFPWPQTGNGAFLRYFVYPRPLGNGKEFETPEEAGAITYDYVLLAWGETETTEGRYTHGWPKFDIPAEKIIFMNEDGSYSGEVKGSYRYEDYKDKKVWGLIKVKH